MLNLAKEILEYKGTVNDVKTLTLHLILDAVCSAKVILVPYDCDKNHSPFLDNGHQTYWCIIVGVVIRASKQTKNIQNLLSHCQKHPTIEHLYILLRNFTLMHVLAWKVYLIQMFLLLLGMAKVVIWDFGNWMI